MDQMPAQLNYFQRPYGNPPVFIVDHFFLALNPWSGSLVFGLLLLLSQFFFFRKKIVLVTCSHALFSPRRPIGLSRGAKLLNLSRSPSARKIKRVCGIQTARDGEYGI